MLDLGFVLLLMIWSLAVGLRMARGLGASFVHPADAAAIAVPLGLGVLALATFGLAELGWLGRPGLAVVLILGFGAAVLVGRVQHAVFPIGWRVAHARRGATGWAFDLALAATVLGTLLTSLAPVTDGDALCYHLQVPKVFLDLGSATFDPDLYETVYPLVTEMLYAVALAFRGPVACRLVQWSLGIVFALNVTALARPALGDRARWAGTIALLVPAVSNGMSAPLNDVALAAFGTAALHALVRWRERPTVGAALLAGTLAGVALGVKYPALAWVGMLGVGCWVRGRGGHLMSFAATALVVGGCWYLRAYIHTGNPVHPFFRGVFGAGLDEVLDPIKRPMAVTPFSLLGALVPMTLQPDRFDSFSHQFGPAFLLFLPALSVMKPPRRVWGLVAFGYSFLMLCLTVRQSMRFVLLAVGPMAVGVAWLASAWERRGGLAARGLLGLLVVVLGFESALALARARHGLPVVLGKESAESYLARREPTYRVGRWLDEHLPESARVIGQDHRGFYLPRPYTMELAHRRRTGLGTRGESPEQIIASLRQRRFTHLLLCPPEPESAVEFDPTLVRRLASWLEGREPLYREPITDPDGVTRRYAIYDLGRTRR